MTRKKNRKIKNVLKIENPSKSRWFSEEDSEKFSKYFEFQKCTDPTSYSKSFGYKVVLGKPDSEKFKNKRVLIFSIEPRGKRFKIFVTIKPFRVFSQCHLNEAIHKWSIFAYGIDSKIFDVFNYRP